MEKKKYKTVLTIAGSDPSGGAGIQADIKTCCALGVYSMSVITAVTVQNSRGVTQSVALSPEVVADQLRAVLDDITPDAVKIGMIPDGDVARIISRVILEYHLHNVVIDPVAISTSGHPLSSPGTCEVMKDELFPLATLVTPNLPEAELLFGMTPSNAWSLFSNETDTSFDILLKGGHATGDNTVTDILLTKKYPEPICFVHQKIDTVNTHGTGCTLSSAIAGFLAHGLDLESSVGKAIDWLSRAVYEGADYSFGSGHGPLNHIFKQIEQWKLK